MSTIVDEFLLIDMVYEVYKNYLMSTIVDIGKTLKMSFINK